MKARELKKQLRKAGWEFVRQSGSHEIWQHPEYGTQTLAVHDDGTEFGKALMSKIKKNMRL
jgi:predicted RNA binding protein YcfA (HicA-like mRNA interferase family)